jgi:hypothetical protein
VSTLNRAPSLGRNVLTGALTAQQGPNSSKLSASEGLSSELDLDRVTSTASGAIVRTGVFKSLWFTLVAVKGTDMESDASHLIRCEEVKHVYMADL